MVRVDLSRVPVEENEQSHVDRSSGHKYMYTMCKGPEADYSENNHEVNVAGAVFWAEGSRTS